MSIQFQQISSWHLRSHFFNPSISDIKQFGGRYFFDFVAASSKEGEEDIVNVGDAERDVSQFCEKFKVTPVRCSRMEN